jgi:hypothetical protein
LRISAARGLASLLSRCCASPRNFARGLNHPVKSWANSDTADNGVLEGARRLDAERDERRGAHHYPHRGDQGALAQLPDIFAGQKNEHEAARRQRLPGDGLVPHADIPECEREEQIPTEGQQAKERDDSLKPWPPRLRCDCRSISVASIGALLTKAEAALRFALSIRQLREGARAEPER